MQYELHNIELLINNIINEACENNFSADKIIQYEKLICNEVKRIKAAFEYQIFNTETETSNQRYFSFHQKRLIHILNNTSKHLSKSLDGNRVHKTFYASVLTSLERMFLIIRCDYPQYFDGSVSAHRSFIDNFVKRIRNKMKRLDSLQSNVYVDQELFKIAIAPIIALIKENGKEWSYNAFEYVELLQDTLIQTDCSIADGNWCRQNLCYSLFSINYNAPGFFKYFTRHVESSLATCETVSDRVDQVSYFYKVINQIKVNSQLSFIRSAKPIKVEMLEWLSDELDYLKEKRQLMLTDKGKDSISSDFKLMFDLSVSQLAYLFKVFIETGVVLNKNTSELIRFLAKFVKTKKAESVSYESFRIKFYNTESGTKDAVKKTLQLFLNYMNKN